MRRVSAALTGRWRLLLSYVLFAASGALAVIGPSPVLLKQGGHVIALVWGGFCIAGAALGVIGYVRRSIAIELLGDMLGASATTTWAVALIMQSFQQDSLASLTATFLAGALITRIGQRRSEERRDARRNGKE